MPLILIWCGMQMHTPPETYVRERVDVRYDLYAVGLVLLELLRGGMDYDSYRVDEMELRLRKGRSALRPSDLIPPPHTSRRLRTIINKTVSARPEDRFASARAMRDAIARVPLIDWRVVKKDDQSILWEGEYAQRRDRRFQVEALKRRGGTWSMSARQQVTRWQRFLPDQIVPVPEGREATAFFDQVLTAALSR